MLPELGDELSILDWIQIRILSVNKYWSALVDNCSTTCIALIGASFITAIVTWMLTKNENDTVLTRRSGSDKTISRNVHRTSHSTFKDKKGKLCFTCYTFMKISW